MGVVIMVVVVDVGVVVGGGGVGEGGEPRRNRGLHQPVHTHTP